MHAAESKSEAWIELLSCSCHALVMRCLLALNGHDSWQYCLGIVASSNSGGTIMGDVLMQAFTTVFDRVNSRVGFAPLSC